MNISITSGLLFLLFSIIPLRLGAQTYKGEPLVSAPIFKCDFCLAAQGISPLEAGASGLRLDLRYLHLSTIYRDGSRAENAGHEVESHLTQQFSLFYSAMPNLTFAAIVPVAHRHSEEIDGTGTGIMGDQFGLSDISLLGRYKVLTEHDFTTTNMVSLAAGVKLPTGRTDGRDSRGDLLDAHIQLGTGSADLLAGASAFFGRDQWALLINMLGALTSEGADGHRFGDNLNYDATVRYRLYMSESGMESVFIGLGGYGELRGREIQDGTTVDDSGGNVMYLGPSLQVNLSSKISAEASYHYPVVHALNGEQLGEDYRMMVGAMILF